MKARKFTLHLVSDATGTTLLGLSRACLAQFEHIEPNQKFWPLVRTEKQLEKVIQRIEENPGPVIFTFVNEKMRRRVIDCCEHLGVPCIPVLDPIFHGLSTFLGRSPKGVPGLQHTMDDAYFKRVAAVDFAMRFDDGRNLKDLKKADVILVGVSRTSKTPTCVFLARRGIKAANIPLVPGVEVPEEHLNLEFPLYVGLIATPERLMHIRKSRLKSDKADQKILSENLYLDEEKIEDEIRKARKIFGRHGWPVIDVTKKSVEETAAEIMSLLQAKRERESGDASGTFDQV
ncbi:MAG: kinase/pyrophosphorylase [Alphaproteobacteria bacterium]|nr:kinase/pyrophosphorylase [Alphaproteobacteria bacterium]MBP7758734.1 kinase/pyrophosphorylase [Alphaproteobacteria bacterium]MBP7761762.1 kinase/pyrophosphorylase [Alphaproteobacteria bacterium]MBP7903705.1 kinase/pyrophosphorylase [Alphaproteobacteria bacterium]